MQDKLPKLLSSHIDGKGGWVTLKLKGGEKVYCSAGAFDEYTANCIVSIKNILGIPTKRIATLGITDVSRGGVCTHWLPGNHIRVDYEEIPSPHLLLAGHVAQFRTVKDIGMANRQHERLFDLDKTIKLLFELGWIRKPDKQGKGSPKLPPQAAPNASRTVNGGTAADSLRAKQAVAHQTTEYERCNARIRVQGKVVTELRELDKDEVGKLRLLKLMLQDTIRQPMQYGRTIEAQVAERIMDRGWSPDNAKLFAKDIANSYAELIDRPMRILLLRWRIAEDVRGGAECSRARDSIILASRTRILANDDVVGAFTQAYGRKAIKPKEMAKIERLALDIEVATSDLARDVQSKLVQYVSGLMLTDDWDTSALIDSRAVNCAATAEARQITKDFGAFLEKRQPLIADAALLPHSKERIQEALGMEERYTCSLLDKYANDGTDPPDVLGNYVESLRVFQVFLHHYAEIDPEDSQRVSQFNRLRDRSDIPQSQKREFYGLWLKYKAKANGDPWPPSVSPAGGAQPEDACGQNDSCSPKDDPTRNADSAN